MDKFVTTEEKDIEITFSDGETVKCKLCDIKNVVDEKVARDEQYPTKNIKNTNFKRTLIISRTRLQSLIKLEELIKDVPSELIERRLISSYRSSVEFKDGSSIEALCYSENMRGKRADLLYLSKELTLEQCDYCSRYLRNYNGEWAEVIFFAPFALEKVDWEKEYEACWISDNTLDKSID